MVRRVAAMVLAGLASAACGDDGGGADGGTPTSDRGGAVAGDGAVTATELCTGAEQQAPDVTVGTGAVVETSGVVVSGRSDGVMWIHDDSGGAAEVVAVGPDGEGRGRYAVEGADAHDWEDIALDRRPGGTGDALYLADIGDNFDEPLRLDVPIRIYRIPEPRLPAAGGGAGPVVGSSEPAVAIPVAYEDGHRDAEALLADPRTGDLLVVSKQWDGTAAGAYRLPADVARAEEPPEGAVTMEREADVPDTEGVFVTGGDVSPDGSVVALRTYEAVRFWDRGPDESVAEALARSAACQVAVDEPQGEAVGFTADGRGWVTISEGDHPPVNRYVLP